MILTLAIVWAVVSTIAALIYYHRVNQLVGQIAEDGRRFQMHAEFLVQGRQVIIDRLTREGDRLRAALLGIRTIITRRPPRRRWLRMCYRVAKEADQGYVRG